MIKKFFASLFVILGLSISLSFINLSVFSEEIESNVTVKIIHEGTLESEKTKESTNDLNKQKNKLPKTNEVNDSSLSLLGLLVILMGGVGIYIINKKNEENKNEKI